MPIQPRQTDEIYSSIQNKLLNGITKLTSFVSGTFNDQFVTSYSEQIRQAELKALAAELAGTAEYAGKELTETDLRRLGIDNVEPSEINQYMDPVQLDLLASNFSIERDEGDRATGQVRFELSDRSVEIEEGFPVGTEPRNDNDFEQFRVDINGTGTIDDDETETVIADPGDEYVTVDVVADEPGEAYNVGPGSIEFLPDTRPGIRAVTNIESTAGGVDRQTDESLRTDIQQAIFRSSGGGTKRGLIGYIETNAESNVSSVDTDEFTDLQPPIVDVVVDGGDPDEIRTLIDEGKPIGIKHNLVRPTVISVGSTIDIIGEDTDTGIVTDAMVQYLTQTRIGETFYRSAFLREILQTDSTIVSVPSVTTYFMTITNERQTFDDTVDEYSLQYGPMGRITEEEHLVGPDRRSFSTTFDDISESSVTISVVNNETRSDLESTEYSVTDESGDGVLDTITIDSGVSIDSQTTARVDYHHSNVSVGTVETVNGTTFIEGTDYEVVDSDGDGLLDAISFALAGSQPNDGERFEYQYEPNRSFDGDRTIDSREDFSASSSDFIVTEFPEK